MDPTIHLGQHPVAEGYRLFAEREAHWVSAVYADWALQVARDEPVLRLLATLPPGKRQPNLVFAAVRWHGATDDYGSVRHLLLHRWDEVSATIRARATQTNEAARCAVLLPFLAELPQPLALLEVGASAGLCLLPDRYSYRYDDGTELDPPTGPSAVVLHCALEGITPPARLPEVVWRAGIDLAPVDVTDDDASAWLETLVWPGQEERRRRLRTALGIARRDPPRVVAGDLLEELPGLAREAPPHATLVVFHTAVLAYLSEPDRTAFVDLVSQLLGHWVSNEGRSVLPAPGIDREVSDGRFVLMVDGRPRALTGPHGQSVAAL